MLEPREPRPGETIDATWARDLVRYVRSLAVRSGRNYTVDRTPGGTIIRPKAIARAKTEEAAAASTHPLQVVAASEGKVSVVYGTVQPASGSAIVPTIGGVSLLNLPAPEITVTGNGFIYLEISLDSGGVAASAAIVFSATALGHTTGLARLGLATISGYSAGPPVAFTIFQSTSGSVAHQQCGSSQLFGRI